MFLASLRLAWPEHGAPAFGVLETPVVLHSEKIEYGQYAAHYIISMLCRVKLAFHDADTDTEFLARILAKNCAYRT